jgi:FtsP/CotA-like multicopper oxidase with cupredoxin domain
MTLTRRNTGRRRRRLLWAGLAAAAAVVIAIAGVAAWLWSSAAVSTAGKVSFTHRLAIPPLAASRTDAAGQRVFDLRAGEGSTQLRPGAATATWGINGDYLGPTLRAARGEKVMIHVHNGLREPTTMHWHGMELPAVMDGGPHQVIKPGATWSPHWRIGQPAATLWYHPHPHGQTAEHIYRGLAGLFIIDDPKTSPAALPHRYGVDDIPLIVQDKNFTDSNQLSLGRSFGGTGILGDTIVVNGTIAPHQEVTSEKVRLRILNASNARIYNIGLPGDRQFTLIGTDGGLLPAPVQASRVELSPGDRAEIIVAMRPGERTVLRSYPPDLGTNFLTGRFTGGDDSFDILQLRAARQLAPAPALPATLAPAPHVPGTAATTRTFDLDGRDINGKGMDMSRIDFTAAAGSAETWQVTNRDDLPHNFHIHGVQFQVLSVGGAAPPAAYRGWQDTIYLKPGGTARIAVPFGAYADPHHPYMYHCHLLYHEDEGMMGQFTVSRPGQATAGGGQPSPGTGHQH